MSIKNAQVMESVARRIRYQRKRVATESFGNTLNG
jgi:hypothetical protein